MADPARAQLLFALTALLLLVAAPVAGCGDGEEEDPGGEGGIVDASVAELLASPDDFDRVRVPGAGAPLGSAGFVLTDGEHEIFVASFPLPALRVDAGDRITVVGRVGEVDRHQVDTVLNEIERGGGQRGSIDREAFAELSLSAGDPYIELIDVHDEGGNDPAAPPGA